MWVVVPANFKPVRSSQKSGVCVKVGKTYDPGLMLQGEPIPSIHIQVPRDTQQARQHLQSKLTSLLEKVDAVPVTRHQKLLLYKAPICL